MPIVVSVTRSQIQSKQAVRLTMLVEQCVQNKNGIFLFVLTSSNINRFSKLFHCQNQEKIGNNSITKDPTTPQVCRYTTL